MHGIRRIKQSLYLKMEMLFKMLFAVKDSMRAVNNTIIVLITHELKTDTEV